MRRTYWTLIAGLAVGLAAAGCDDTLRGVKKDTKENVEATKRAAEDSGLDEAAQKAAERARQAGVVVKRKAEEIASDLGDGKRPATAREDEDKDGDSLDKTRAKVKEAGREIASETKAAVILADVKQALMRDKAVDASHIDVDVDDDARTVILRGSVPNKSQKTQAEIVARAHAKDYQVQNKLALQP
jgi:osmotically-inducible protein OsmY